MSDDNGVAAVGVIAIVIVIAAPVAVLLRLCCVVVPIHVQPLLAPALFLVEHSVQLFLLLELQFVVYVQHAVNEFLLRNLRGRPFHLLQQRNDQQFHYLRLYFALQHVLKRDEAVSVLVDGIKHSNERFHLRADLRLGTRSHHVRRREQKRRR